MINPIGDRVAILVDKVEETTVSGIYIPTENKVSNMGTVVAVGPGRVLPTGETVPLQVQGGDKVVFQPYAGTRVSEAGQEFLVMYESDIICTIN